jgi:hypothetical protein
MKVVRAQVVAILRSRGLNARADWADRTLPDIVDTEANAGLLRTLAIAPESLQSTDATATGRSADASQAQVAVPESDTRPDPLHGASPNTGDR